MYNLRTSSLFHYTSYNNLKKILEEGIIPNYCRESFSKEDIGSDPIIGIPMVAFCDIPLTRTQDFTKRYGKHAIGLKKEWAIKNSINPIFYVYDLNNFPIKTLLNYRKSNIKNQVNLMGFIKRYEEDINSKNISKKSKLKQCNYEENEWRYVVNECDKIKWLRGSEEYKQWRGELKSNKPIPSQYFMERKLIFDIEDITYIIVEQENQISGLVTKIEKLKNIGDNSEKLTDKRKILLISRIISMERIKRDF